MVWVSPTYSTTLDLKFRDEKGMVVLEDQFRGTVEWTVTFPAADRYEYRFLTGMAVLRRDGKVAGIVAAMTLRSDQKTSDPY